jgi:serine phosphatase RsbU (regulator of sigma subunit)
MLSRLSGGVTGVAVIVTRSLWRCHIEDEAGVVYQDLPGAGAARPQAPPRIRVLLIEDDDGDALIVQELLQAAAAVQVQRARSLAEARPLLASASCVLLDLGLPDSRDLDGVRWLREHVPDAAVVVLTGRADEFLGAAAVRSGAQDYLVKGHVDETLLYRVIRYAVERRQAEKTQLELHLAQVLAGENTRLARGLLPSPLITDPHLAVATRYQPGGGQMQLGGDFYDLIEAPDGWLHALVGDVCGRGPDEAALGVCLRVAWRTMVLAGQPMTDVLFAVQQVLEHERHDDRLFATLCILSVAPDRRSGLLRLAGHPPPVLISPSGVRELEAPVRMPLGIRRASEWPAGEVELGRRWTVLLYTDGLIEGRIGAGRERLGSEGLIRGIRAVAGGDERADPMQSADQLLECMIARVRELNGGDLDDDIAVLALDYDGQDNLWRPRPPGRPKIRRPAAGRGRWAG